MVGSTHGSGLVQGKRLLEGVRRRLKMQASKIKTNMPPTTRPTIARISFVSTAVFEDEVGCRAVAFELLLDEIRPPQETFVFPKVSKRGVLVPHTPFLHMIIRMKSFYVRIHKLTHH